MEEVAKLALSDKEIKPTDDHIFSIMGDKKALWIELMDYLDKSGRGFTGQWNWYNDGKQWLYKMTLKKQTVFWSALYSDTFRITFYFGAKAESAILASDIPDNLKDEFMTGQRFGKIRAISLKIHSSEDVAAVKKVVDVKLKIR